MTKAMKKGLMLMLAICICFSAVSAGFMSHAAAAGTSTITQEAIKKVLDLYNYKNKYHWGYDSSMSDAQIKDKIGTSTSNTKGLYTYGSRSQCCGFAEFLAYAISGSDPRSSSWEKYKSVSDAGGLQVGDLLGFKFNGKSEHIAMVYSVSGNNFTVVEVWSGSYKNEIHIGGKFNDKYGDITQFTTSNGQLWYDGYMIHRYTGKLNTVIPSTKKDASGSITTAMIDNICSQYGYISGKTYWVYNESKDKKNHPKLPYDWYVGSTDSSYKTANQIGSGKTLSYMVGNGYNECAGFASFIGLKLTGVNPKSGGVDSASGAGTGWKIYTQAQIKSSGGLKVGDIIRTTKHSAVVYKVNSDGKFTVAQCFGGSANLITINVGFNTSSSTATDFNKLSGVRYVLRYEGSVSPSQGFTVQETMNAVYRFNKDDETRAQPFEASKLSKSFKTGDLVSINASVNNTYNHIWYRTTDGTFVYSGDVDLFYTVKDEKKQNFTVIGKESKVLAIKIMLDATSYSAPYDGTISGQEFSKEKTVYKVDSQVQSVATVQNKHGNTWYKLADGTFLYSGWLKFVSEVKPAVTVTLKAGSAKPGSGSNNTGYPCGKLTKGKNFGLRGIIEASENLKSVLGIIFDVGKFKVAQKVTVAPNAKTLNIQNSNINNKLIFDKLDNGNYVYAVVATTVSGYTATVILSEFSVGTGTYSLKDFADTVFQVAKETGLTVAGSATNAVSALAGSVATACTHPGASWVITRAATALQEGEEQRICPDCKKVLETRKIEKLLCSHENAEWKVVKAATETEDGQRNLVCPDCEQIVDMETIHAEKKLLPGDVNEDGVVDGRDVLRLMKFLANEEDPKTGKLIEINEDNADVDGSGSINEKDLLRLVKYLGGENVTLEPGAMSGNG